MSRLAFQWARPGEDGIHELRLGEEVVGRVRPIRENGRIVGYWWDAWSEGQGVPMRCSLLTESHYKTDREARKACAAYVGMWQASRKRS